MRTGQPDWHTAFASSPGFRSGGMKSTLAELFARPPWMADALCRLYRRQRSSGLHQLLELATGQRHRWR